MNNAVEEIFEIPVPPSPQRVAARALCLIAVAYRGSVESDPDEQNASVFHQKLLAWVEDCDLKSELEAEEWALIQSPIGTLTSRQEINA